MTLSRLRSAVVSTWVRARNGLKILFCEKHLGGIIFEEKVKEFLSILLKSCRSVKECQFNEFIYKTNCADFMKKIFMSCWEIFMKVEWWPRSVYGNSHNRLEISLTMLKANSECKQLNNLSSCEDFRSSTISHSWILIPVECSWNNLWVRVLPEKFEKTKWWRRNSRRRRKRIFHKI